MKLLTEAATSAADVVADLEINKAREAEERARMAMTKVQEAEAKAAAVAREAEERLNQPMLIGGVELRRGLGAIISKQFKVQATKPDMAEVVEQASKFFGGGDTHEMKMGRPEAAALGLAYHLKVDEFDLFERLGKGTEAIKYEVAHFGTEEDKECLHYILDEAAGTSPTLYSNSAHPRDCDARGVRDDRQVMGEDGNLRPMVFEDFCNHPSAKTAKLGAAAVLAIRLYSTAAFKSLNNPLRDADRTEAHPFYATIFFLTDGIRKLRAVEASKVKDKGDGKPRDQGVRFEGSSKGGASGKARHVVDLWRGMKNLTMASSFEEEGGCEMALLSTTDNAAVALEYATSHSPLLIKLATTSFMDRGADISWASAFPGEREFLYPPLTFMQPTGRKEVVTFTYADDDSPTGMKASDHMTITVIEAVPVIA